MNGIGYQEEGAMLNPCAPLEVCTYGAAALRVMLQRRVIALLTHVFALGTHELTLAADICRIVLAPGS